MGNAKYLLISAILTLIIIYDQIISMKKKPEFKEAKFAVRNVSNAMNYVTVILLVCAILFNLYVYKMTKDSIMLFLTYWMLLLLVQSVSYLAKTGGINEAGIWFSGRFYPWEAIKAFYCDKNTGRVGLAVMKSAMGFKYSGKLRLQAVKSQIEEINELLSANIK